jgi:hypothetical protein
MALDTSDRDRPSQSGYKRVGGIVQVQEMGIQGIKSRKKGNVGINYVNIAWDETLLRCRDSNVDGAQTLKHRLAKFESVRRRDWLKRHAKINTIGPSLDHANDCLLGA